MSAPVQRSPEDPPPQVTATIGKSRTSSLQQKVKRIYLWALLFLWLFNTQWLWFCYKINNEFKSSPHFENVESIGRILFEYSDWKLNNFGHFRSFYFGQFQFSEISQIKILRIIGSPMELPLYELIWLLKTLVSIGQIVHSETFWSMKVFVPFCESSVT